MSAASSPPEPSSPFSIGQVPVYHWGIAGEQAEDIQAAAKWAWKCLVDVANVLCALYCDPLCSKEGLSVLVLEGFKDSDPEARKRREPEWRELQKRLHKAVACLPPFENVVKGCPACAVVTALAQFPKLVPFSPMHAVATLHRNAVDCYPKIAYDPQQHSIPCCIIRTMVGTGHECEVVNAVRERALLALDLNDLPPIPPWELSDMKPVLMNGQAALLHLAQLGEEVQQQDESGTAGVPAADDLRDAIEHLLRVVEKHRLTFLYCACPQRMNPSVPKSRVSAWETVEEDSVCGWHEMTRDIDLNGDFLFRHRWVLEAYAQEAVARFGTGEGCKPRILTDDGKWVDVMGGTLPLWSLEGDTCLELEDSSQAVLDACADVSDADTEGTLCYLIQQAMAVAHDKDESRWYASVGVRWGYLSELDGAIDAIRKARVGRRDAKEHDGDSAQSWRAMWDRPAFDCAEIDDYRKMRPIDFANVIDRWEAAFIELGQTIVAEEHEKTRQLLQDHGFEKLEALVRLAMEERGVSADAMTKLGEAFRSAASGFEPGPLKGFLTQAMVDIERLKAKLALESVAPSVADEGSLKSKGSSSTALALSRREDGWHWFVNGEDKGRMFRGDDTIIGSISRILYDQIGHGWTPHKTFYQKLGWKKEEYFGRSGETGRMQKQLSILRGKLGLQITFRKENGVRFGETVVKS